MLSGNVNSSNVVFKIPEISLKQRDYEFIQNVQHKTAKISTFIFRSLTDGYCFCRLFSRQKL